MVIYFLIVFLLYGALVIGLIVGWQISMEADSVKPDKVKFHKISVIVPFRDEQDNLPTLIDCFKSQGYPVDLIQFIFVNDHSSDQSDRLIDEYARLNPVAKLLRLSSTYGKKQAITLGVENALGEIIVTTDADCSMSSTWLEKINEAFQKPDCNMIVGAVRIDPAQSFFSKLQAMEFASLIGSGVATLTYGFPTMCNGANLAFRKSAFIAVSGYEGNLEIPSGDDEFLMRKIHHKFSKSIHFLRGSDSVVYTKPQSTLQSFLHQRVRWAGKWRHNQSISTKLLAAFVFMFHVSVILFAALFLAGWVPLRTFFLLMGCKLVLEFLFLNQVCQFLKIKWRWTSFLTLQFVYPVYVFWIALLAQRKSFVWKGRNVKHNQRVANQET